MHEAKTTSRGREEECWGEEGMTTTNTALGDFCHSAWGLNCGRIHWPYLHKGLPPVSRTFYFFFFVEKTHE